MKLNTPYITIPHKDSPVPLVELSEDEFSSIQNDSEIVNEFSYYQRRLKEIEFNKDDFTNSKSYFTQLFKDSSSKEIGYDFRERAFIEMNRHLNNFIASFKSMTEHCENRIVGIFGKVSKELIEYKTFESGLYDNHFSYRFLKRLRDYAIHANYPIDNVSFDNITFGLGYDSWFEMRVVFSRDKLLGNKTLRSKLRVDLEMCEEFFDVVPFILQVTNLLKSVLSKFITIAHPDFIQSSERIIELYTKYGQEQLSLTKSQLNGYKIDYKSIILPIDNALKLNELINKSA